MMAYDRVRENIRYLRIYNGMSQTDLAKRAGLSTNIIARIEGGDRQGKLSTLETIAVKGLGIQITGLIELDLKHIFEEAIEKYKVDKD